MDTKNINLNQVPKTPFKFFLYASKPHRKWAFLAIGAIILAAGISSGTSYFYKLIIDAVEANNLESALFWGMMFPVVIFIVQLLYRLSGHSGMHWTVGANKTAMDSLVEYLLDHSHGYFSNRFSGSITNKTRNVTGAIDQIVPDFLWAHLDTAVNFTVTFILMLTVDVTTAVIFLFLILVLVLLNKQFAVRKTVLARENAEAGTLLQGRAVDMFSNVMTVRQYVNKDFEFSELKKLTANKYTKSIANWGYTEKMLLINSFVLFGFSLVIFWLLINKWGEGAISTGDFVLILALVSNVAGALLFIGRAFNATARTVGEMKEGLDDIMLPFEVVDKENAAILSAEIGKINWNNVTFDFTGNKVFENFNLVIEPKQRVGLVGTSGAGKSTFVSLILRQHEIMAGEIEIDGQDISKVTQDSLRAAIAVVPQEPTLFHRSIRENIAYGNKDATLGDIIAIAKKAQAHDFIVKLTDGYDTLVGERGIKLSGGQKQRVAIARAMLKNAPILILDEATSALDSESEVEIQKALHELMAGKTVIAIAHRLSTLREMDRIIVLQGGEITEDGKHDELVQKDGTYAKLWQHQAGGFIQE
jgi:ATP-binding cassette subfamily B protein